MPIFTILSNGMIATLTSPSCLAAFCNVVSRFCDAVLSSVILPLLAIEPVLSSTSASSSFFTPHFTCVEDPMSSWSWPSIRVNVVGTVPLAADVEHEAALLRAGQQRRDLGIRDFRAG